MNKTDVNPNWLLSIKHVRLNLNFNSKNGFFPALFQEHYILLIQIHIFYSARKDAVERRDAN
jgi:hypothetical protein